MPATGGGQIGAFVFTILGFPMHLMLLINLGRTIALQVQILAKDIEIKFYELRRRISNGKCSSLVNSFPVKKSTLSFFTWQISILGVMPSSRLENV